MYVCVYKVHTCMYARMCSDVCTCVCVRMSVRIYIYIYTYSYLFACVCVCSTVGSPQTDVGCFARILQWHSEALIPPTASKLHFADR